VELAELNDKRAGRQFAASAPGTKCTGGTKMTQITELATQVLIRGRQIKFTPERIQQIKNLVERGKSREEIAELIGVTVGSLQVTCSRLGISLRRPTFNTGAGSLRREEPRFKVSTPGSSGSDSALLQLTTERLERHARPGPAEQAQAPTPCQAQDTAPWQEWAKRANEAGAASFAIRMQYRGEERTTELPLTQDVMGQLAFEAAFRNVTIGELIGELIAALLNKDLLQTVLEHKKPR
jgi:hypothetical protein